VDGAGRKETIHPRHRMATVGHLFGNLMGLGLMDGFPTTLEFWEHWCKSEGDIIGTEKGYPCNWCGAEEKSENEEQTNVVLL